MRHKTPNEEDWKQIKFMIFDSPLVKESFANRLKVINKRLDGNKIAQAVKQTLCKSKDDLETLMDDITGGKGEGVMIKNPDSSYERKRSYQLLKVKRFEDAEATVIGH